MKSNETAKSTDRTCSFCHKHGHNVRTCEKAKKAKMTEQPTEKAKVGSTSKPATANGSAAVANGSTALIRVEENNGLSADFEETIRTLQAGPNTLMRAVLRDTLGDGVSILLSLRKEGVGTKEINFDLETAVKAYELLGWALRKHNVVPQLPPAPKSSTIDQ